MHDALISFAIYFSNTKQIIQVLYAKSTNFFSFFFKNFFHQKNRYFYPPVFVAKTALFLVN